MYGLCFESCFISPAPTDVSLWKEHLLYYSAQRLKYVAVKSKLMLRHRQRSVSKGKLNHLILKSLPYWIIDWVGQGCGCWHGNFTECFAPWHIQSEVDNSCYYTRTIVHKETEKVSMKGQRKIKPCTFNMYNWKAGFWTKIDSIFETLLILALVQNMRSWTCHRIIEK